MKFQWKIHDHDLSKPWYELVGKDPEGIYENIAFITFNKESRFVGQFAGQKTCKCDDLDEAKLETLRMIIDHGDNIVSSAKHKMSLSGRKISLDRVELSSRLYGTLIKNGINTLGDVLDLLPRKLILIKGIGRKSVEELLDTLNDYHMDCWE